MPVKTVSWYIGYRLLMYQTVYDDHGILVCRIPFAYVSNSVWWSWLHMRFRTKNIYDIILFKCNLYKFYLLFQHQTNLRNYSLTKICLMNEKNIFMNTIALKDKTDGTKIVMKKFCFFFNHDLNLNSNQCELITCSHFDE